MDDQDNQNLVNNQGEEEEEEEDFSDAEDEAEDGNAEHPVVDVAAAAIAADLILDWAAEPDEEEAAAAVADVQDADAADDPLEMNENVATALGTALADGLNAQRPVAGGRKPQAFKLPASPQNLAAEWSVWRKQFEMIATIQRWNDLRKRRELFACMGLDVATRIADINVEPPGDGDHYDNVIALYEARFVTAPDTDLARVVFRGSKQYDDEDCLAWHARTLTSFLMAFPGAQIDGAQISSTLRDQFCTGLKDPVQRAYVWDHSPQTYQRCLELCLQKVSTQQMMTKGEGEDENGVDGGVNAFGSWEDRNRGGAPNKCYFCGEGGHFRQDCPMVPNVVAYMHRAGLNKEAQNLKGHIEVMDANRDKLRRQGGGGRRGGFNRNAAIAKATFGGRQRGGRRNNEGRMERAMIAAMAALAVEDEEDEYDGYEAGTEEEQAVHPDEEVQEADAGN